METSPHAARPFALDDGAHRFFFDHRNLHVRHRVGPVVRLDPAHEGLVVLVVEALDLPAFAVVLVDGVLVEHGMRRAPVEFADGSGRAPGR